MNEQDRLAVEAVVLDIDGTLYRSDDYERHLSEAINRILARRLGVSLEEAKQILADKKKQFLTVSKSVESLGFNRKQFYTELGSEVNPAAYLRPDQRLNTFLRKLRERGHRIVGHTNSGRILANKILGSIGLSEGDFDIIVTSDDAEPKPSKEGYELILRRLGIAARRVLYVGDRFEVEVKPAKEIGMKTALVSPTGQSVDEVEFVVKGLLDLEGILL